MLFRSANINDEVNLRKRLEKIVSDGINYGANKEDVKGMKRFADIKRIMPQFETFKSVYLKLREMGIEEQFAETTSGLDYDKMMEEDLEYMRTHQTYQPSHVFVN